MVKWRRERRFASPDFGPHRVAQSSWGRPLREAGGVVPCQSFQSLVFEYSYCRIFRFERHSQKEIHIISRGFHSFFLHQESNPLLRAAFSLSANKVISCTRLPTVRDKRKVVIFQANLLPEEYEEQILKRCGKSEKGSKMGSVLLHSSGSYTGLTGQVDLTGLILQNSLVGFRLYIWI